MPHLEKVFRDALTSFQRFFGDSFVVVVTAAVAVAVAVGGLVATGEPSLVLFIENAPRRRRRRSGGIDEAHVKEEEDCCRCVSRSVVPPTTNK